VSIGLLGVSAEGVPSWRLSLAWIADRGAGVSVAQIAARADVSEATVSRATSTAMASAAGSRRPAPIPGETVAGCVRQRRAGVAATALADNAVPTPCPVPGLMETIKPRRLEYGGTT